MAASSRFNGSNRLLLQDYFDLKVKLMELQTMKKFRNSDELMEQINKTETSICEILSMFDKGQLLQILYMSLDIDCEHLKSNGYISLKV